MSARSTLIHLGTKAGLLLGALFVVGVVLAAIPGHHEPDSPEPSGQPRESAPAQARPNGDRELLSCGRPEQGKSDQAQAPGEMTQGRTGGSNLHLRQIPLRPQTPLGAVRASQAAKLRAGIDRYRNDRVVLSGAFELFLPELVQADDPFTKGKSGLEGAFAFDPTRPTLLLDKGPGRGFEFLGAIDTIPKQASEAALDARGPLSTARRQLHTNLSLPTQACSTAGGGFGPVLSGWMVQVYCDQRSPDKNFALYRRDR